MKIYLDNKWVTFNNLRLPPIKTAIDDSLDTATVVFYSEIKEAIAKNTYVNLQNKIMVVFNDVSENFSKEKGIWKHTMSLIEPTHLLDLIFVNNICLTNRNDTLYQQLVKLTQNITFFSNSFINETQIHPDLANAVMGLKSAEIYCLNSTAKECFNELLRTINARVELQVQYIASTQTMQLWITYRSGNKRNNLVSFKKMSSTYSYDANNMTNNLTFIGKNAVTRYPITQGYEGFKTTETTLTSDNAAIILMYEVEDIVSFKVLVDVETDLEVKRWDLNNNLTGTFYPTRTFTIEVDLTENLIEEEAYNLLTSPQQQLKIPYSKNNVIKTGTMNLWHTFWKGTGSKIEAIVIEKAKEYVEFKNLNELMKNDPEYPSNSTDYIYTYNILSNGRRVKNDIENLAYQIMYYPFLNIYGNLTKDVTKDKIFTIVDNQQEEVLSIEKYSDLLGTKIKRIGNMEIEIDEINQPIKELNDYTEDGYVIYEREIAEDSIETKAHYKLSKDYNLLNARIAVDQKKRLYEIPLDYQDCFLTPQYTLKVGFTYNDDRMKFFNKNAIVSCVSTLLEKINISNLPETTYTLNQSIRGVWFKTEKENNEIARKYLSCSTYALNDTLHFSILTYDNYSSALSVGGQVLGGKKAVYNPYCDEIGEFDKITYALCIYNPTSYIDRHIAYPNEISAGQKVTLEKTINFNKDRTQRICMDIGVGIKSTNKNIILGKEFFQNNLLLQNVKIPKLYLYYSYEEEYQGYAAKALGEKLENYNIEDLFNITVDNVVSLNYISTFSPNIKSWAIADENRNIYIAVNGNENKIYFY